MKKNKKKYARPQVTICCCGTGKAVQDIGFGTGSAGQGGASQAATKENTFVDIESLEGGAATELTIVEVESIWDDGDGDDLRGILE